MYLLFVVDSVAVFLVNACIGDCDDGNVEDAVLLSVVDVNVCDCDDGNVVAAIVFSVVDAAVCDSDNGNLVDDSVISVFGEVICDDRNSVVRLFVPDKAVWEYNYDIFLYYLSSLSSLTEDWIKYI